MRIDDDVLMPLCVGTSLAVIVPTSISSFIGHYRKGAVDIDVLKVWALPITAGVLCGILTASVARPILFKGVFIVVCLFLAIRLLVGKDKWWLLCENDNFHQLAWRAESYLRQDDVFEACARDVMADLSVALSQLKHEAPIVLGAQDGIDRHRDPTV